MATQGNDGATLEAALKEGSIQSGSTAELTGMIDKSEKNRHVKFTPTDCDNWMDIPVETIASWEFVGRQSCHDHSHPVVRLKLKRPEDSGAALYFDIMTNTLAALSARPMPAATAARAIPTARSAPVGGIGGEGQCKYYACGTCWDGSVMLCDDGALSGCIPTICSDVVMPSVGFANLTIRGGHWRGYRL